MDTPALGRLDGFGAALDVAAGGAGQPADNGLGDGLGDLADRLEIAVGSDRKAGFDHVDAHFLEDAGDTQLLVDVHGCAGGLLAIAQRGVEYCDALGIFSLFGTFGFAHLTGPSSLGVAGHVWLGRFP